MCSQRPTDSHGGLLVTRTQHGQRCFIGVKNLFAQHFSAQRNPPIPTQAPRVEIGNDKRTRPKILICRYKGGGMIGIPGHQRLSQQCCSGNAFLNHLGRERCLNQCLTARTSPLPANMTFDAECAWRIVKFLTDILANAL